MEEAPSPSIQPAIHARAMCSGGWRGGCPDATSPLGGGAQVGRSRAASTHFTALVPELIALFGPPTVHDSSTPSTQAPTQAPPNTHTNPPSASTFSPTAPNPRPQQARCPRKDARQQRFRTAVLAAAAGHPRIVSLDNYSAGTGVVARGPGGSAMRERGGQWKWTRTRGRFVGHGHANALLRLCLSVFLSLEAVTALLHCCAAKSPRRRPSRPSQPRELASLVHSVVHSSIPSIHPDHQTTGPHPIVITNSRPLAGGFVACLCAAPCTRQLPVSFHCFSPFQRARFPASLRGAGSSLRTPPLTHTITCAESGPAHPSPARTVTGVWCVGMGMGMRGTCKEGDHHP